MKRFIVFTSLATIALNSFAYGYSSSSFEMPGWLILMYVIMIAWGILEIILFFKLWGMTNDIRALKKDYFHEHDNNTAENTLQRLRTSIVMGNRTKTKEILLENFIHNVESSFSKFPQEKQEQDEQKGESYTVSLKEQNLQESILQYVEKLRTQFNTIGEELPEYIGKMKTYNDYYNLFTEENLLIDYSQTFKEEEFKTREEKAKE